uniref:L51_S25_CI-B8 domain-containing protein n=1 Tax=Rhabditophanes sp. KR3021 TaxID=114890 RepID=A0AC35UE39_9BILA
MCQMWQKIRYGVRWLPREQLALACRAMNFKEVKNIKISLDPYHAKNNSLREFWFNIQAPKVRATNPTLKITSEIRNDRQDPFFVAELKDGKKLLFKTADMPSADLVKTFNRLVGQAELGSSGVRPKISQ